MEAVVLFAAMSAALKFSSVRFFAKIWFTSRPRIWNIYDKPWKLWTAHWQTKYTRHHLCGHFLVHTQGKSDYPIHPLFVPRSTIGSRNRELLLPIWIKILKRNFQNVLTVPFVIFRTIRRPTQSNDTTFSCTFCGIENFTVYAILKLLMWCSGQHLNLQLFVC